MQTNNTVQLSLFSRGSAMGSQYAEAVTVIDRVKKDKDKRVVLDGKGQPVLASQTVRLLPRKSDDDSKTTLATVTGLSGQGLMAFEVQARTALLESASSHMARLIASGDYTFDMSRINPHNGKFLLSIKPKVGAVAILTTEELKQQAAAMGFTLIEAPKELPATSQPSPSAPAPVPQNGEVEVVIAKGKAKAAKAARAAIVKA